MVALSVPAGALALEGDGETALRFTVGPSGVEGESLDEKLARRDRSFRFICIGCSHAPGPIDGRPFEPIRTLNAPQLSNVLAAERNSGSDSFDPPR